jgi:uncharacterized HAD superfamily protein
MVCFVPILCLNKMMTGEKYINFLLNSPLFIPGSKIGTIVTSRLEKYRKETETWLAANNIKYNDLVMLDLPNMEARQRANNPR